MMTVLEFIAATAKLCDEWDRGDRIPPDNKLVSDLLGKINSSAQGLRGLEMGAESLTDQAAVIGIIELLKSLKVRVQAIATQDL